MNSLRTWFVLLAVVLGLAGTSPRVQAQNENSATGGIQAPSATASKAEVDQLRQELAAQRRTIEQLRNLVEQLVEVKSRPASPANDGAPLNGGWNAELFFIKSNAGKFQIQPYGYVQTDYRSYIGDGSPANTFSVRRGRFGFQGNYGDHYQFGLLVDAAASTGAIIRD